MKIIASLLGLLICVVALAIAPEPATATGYATGTVTHVSTANIKIKDSAGVETSYLLAPSFDQMKIQYHQSLGVRYCDKINVIK
ncbi:MAG: hypothetical protein JO347_08540 [Candidatus Eremiobacteraeota bacterium]|nr:hypothetical protein [Candidatus Eremiobacteraeota bacterium]MBV8282094.1 hypothetical protein [Candidatus Eremiobacteraeota bacterium]